MDYSEGANNLIAYSAYLSTYLFSVGRIKLEAGHQTVLWNSLSRVWERNRHLFSKVVYFRKRSAVQRMSISIDLKSLETRIFGVMGISSESQLSFLVYSKARVPFSTNVTSK